MICKWPVALTGSDSGLMISWPLASPGWSATFSAHVLPVTVICDPSNMLLSIMNLMTPGVPPMAWTSSMTYFPDGLRSARNGVTSEMRWKSSNEMRTAGSWHARDIAIRCKTAFVDPPVTITIRIAFSNAAFVMMSRGFKSSSSKFLIAAPAASHSACFSSESAGIDDEYGRDMPKASMAVAIVLAVYMPPHAPWPGHECRTISERSSSETLSYT
mmetsp:Transcript_8323/g.26024  ORF Transcript_8323/g.26024 Transcript_8323/m.26024 type:complete len:215 (-) Transcript_8323:723-1367(-)